MVIPLLQAKHDAVMALQHILGFLGATQAYTSLVDQSEHLVGSILARQKTFFSFFINFLIEVVAADSFIHLMLPTIREA